MPIHSPVTDNCPSWISGRVRMIVEVFFMTKSQQKNVARPGLEPVAPWFAVRLTPDCARWPGSSASANTVIIWLDKMEEQKNCGCKLNDSLSETCHVYVMCYVTGWHLSLTLPAVGSASADRDSPQDLFEIKKIFIGKQVFFFLHCYGNGIAKRCYFRVSLFIIAGERNGEWARPL